MSDSNFKFLATEFPAIFAEAQKAEQYAHVEPRFSVVLSRTALEKMITWLYENDYDLEMPYDSSLSSLMHNHAFRELLNPLVYTEINLVRKIGNKGAHGHKINAYEALTALKNNFRFFSWVSRYYSNENPVIATFFNEEILPTQSTGTISKKELEKYIKAHETARKEQAKLIREREEVLEENRVLREQVKEQKLEIEARKKEREEAYKAALPVPPLSSEKETRKQLIDLLLFEAGWTHLIEGRNTEFEVTGMPRNVNPSGKGYVDYVLWDDNGKPLAVIEAKASIHEVSKGQHQAKLYADALEKMTGQRPIIFYSNGYEHYIWDDTFYPPRKVAGFYSKSDLQTLMRRRGAYLDLREYNINKEIAGRPYQIQAITAIAERLVADAPKGITGKHRRALLVMATGTGKTRTSAAIVEMLISQRWAKRVLFLADRTALVTQAKNAFNEHLPHLNAIDLSKGESDDTARLVFSTYPTMLNRIDEVNKDGFRPFGVGHFDLVIIDEAHRSVYQKYQAIFEYFDALYIGLTATPVSEVDRHTYNLFDVREQDPTFAYELEQAVKDGFLVPPKALKVPVKFPREGLDYSNLSDEEKEHYSELFGVPIADEKELMAQLSISKSKINSLLFNAPTVDIVLDVLMQHGQKVESGDKLGKTIIFAKNHKHAVFIKERFHVNYPEYGGDFIQVIDNYVDKAQDLIESFCFDKGEEKPPQIAVSVDMMDTGIDAPRVLNLVFFKEVYSHTKYWQMIGRGTRLCPDIFGPGQDKEFYLLLDVCGNVEFFNENPEGYKSITTLSLSEILFRTQLELISLVQSNPKASDEDKNFAVELTDELHKKVSSLEETSFAVRRELKTVKKYQNRDNWALLDEVKINELSMKLGNLITYDSESSEMAKQFDLLIYKLEIAILSSSKSQERMIKNLQTTAKRLENFQHIPSVNQRLQSLQAMQSDEFWQKIQLIRLEDLRIEIREIIHLLKDEPQNPVYSFFKDELGEVKEVKIIATSADLGNYKARVEAFIRENKNHLVIDKIHRNIPITEAELEALENFLSHEKFTLSDIEKEFETKSLGVFVRKILGLDIESAQEHFAAFIEEEDLDFRQMEFVKRIINYLNKNGVIDKTKLTHSPFTDLDDKGILGVFEEKEKLVKLIKLIDDIDFSVKGA